MNTTRIISRLDIKGPNLVKGVHLEGLRVLGNPKLFVEQYYDDGIDEIIYMDTVASLYGRNNLVEFVNHTAESIFVPLTVGGGVRTLDDISSLLKAGADKIAINTAAVNNPQIIYEAANKFGSSCIVVSIEAKKKGHSQWECFTDNGRESTGIDVLKWAKQIYKLGAGEILLTSFDFEGTGIDVLKWAKQIFNLGGGEILLTSIDFEGTGMGFDIELTKNVSEAVTIPVIASGGCGNKDHVL